MGGGGLLPPPLLLLLPPPPPQPTASVVNTSVRDANGTVGRRHFFVSRFTLSAYLVAGKSIARQRSPCRVSPPASVHRDNATLKMTVAQALRLRPPAPSAIASRQRIAVLVRSKVEVRRSSQHRVARRVVGGKKRQKTVGPFAARLLASCADPQRQSCRRFGPRPNSL